MRTLRAIAPPVAGLALALGLLGSAQGLDEIARAGQLGPGFWPRLVLWSLAVTCLVRAAMDWRRAQAGAARPEPGGAEGVVDDPPGPISRPLLAVAIGLVLLYVVLTPLVGFPLATAAFMAAFMRLSGARSPVGLAAGAVLGTVVLLYVFVKAVYLPLPKGTGPFEDVTIALYRALGIF